MKIIITERQEELLKKLIMNEYMVRDASMYAAKAKSIKDALDKKYAYIPVRNDKDLFGKREWTIFTLENGKPYRPINDSYFFILVQRDFPKLCEDPKMRDEMLEKILDEWLAEKKENK